VVELEGAGADDADSTTRLDEAVVFARPRRGPARFSRNRVWVFPLAIIVGFVVLHAARVVPSAAGEAADETSARSSAMQSKFRSVAAGVVAVAGLACADGAMADAVEWRVADGGNGHWYEVRDWGATGWANARFLAESVGGHLATLTTSAESVFASQRKISSTRTVYFGGFQTADACEPGCGWQWVTGEPMEFTRWGVSQPDDFNGPDGFDGEDVLGFWNTASLGDLWSDQRDCLVSCAPPYYLIEWSADCNNNGVVDFGEIRNGFAVDTNGNNIPDECECASDPTLAICCPEDIIEDGAVNAIDLAAILNTWGTDGGKFPRADVDGSGTVDGADLAAVLSQWGPCE
jgi:hypothetical protein